MSINKLFLLFKPYNVLWKLIQLRWRGMLYEEGWFEAACYYKSINKQGEPIPWWTYSFNDFFIPKLNKNLEIFEYGSGNSTLFLSQKVKSITSIEHNKDFFEKMKNEIKSIENIFLKYSELDYDGKYCRKILEENKLFDVIIIDGRDRVNCIKQSLERVKKDGIIILDDSQRENYKEGIDYLIKNNYKHIYFTGISAGTYKKKSTSIFYKNNNFLGL